MQNKKNDAADLLKELTKQTTFDRLIHEIEATNIPTRYIDKIAVFYKDGTVIELSGEEISMPVPVNMDFNPEDMEGPFRLMKEVKVFINIDVLEKDVNSTIDDIFSPFFE